MKNRLFDTVYTKYLQEVRVLTGLLPAEQLSLEELLKNPRPSVRLRDGTMHRIDREDLERMASRLPWYMHSLTRLPLVVVKDGESYRLTGDKWSLRSVSLLLRGELGLDPSPVLRLGELERLLRDYRSLVFITIKADREAAQS
jgi:uncharacterized protein (UPF0216 family)